MAAHYSKQNWCSQPISILWSVICFAFVLSPGLLLTYIICRYDLITSACEQKIASYYVKPDLLHTMFHWLSTWSSSNTQDVDLSLCMSSCWETVLFILTEALPQDMKYLAYLTIQYLAHLLEKLKGNIFNLCSDFISMITNEQFQNKYLPVIMKIVFGILASLIFMFLIKRLIVWVKNKSNPNSQTAGNKNSSFSEQSGSNKNDNFPKTETTPHASFSWHGGMTLQHYSKQMNLAQDAVSTHNDIHKSHWSLLSTMLRCLAGLTLTAALVSIPWEFVRLYQAQVAQRVSKVSMGIPAECDPATLTLFQKVVSVLKAQFSWGQQEDTCYSYHYSLLVDPLWEVSPLMVMSSVLTRCLLHPLELFSTTLGRSLRAFFSEIPAQWQPVFLVVSMATTLVILLVFFRYRLAIPLFLRIEPKTPVQSPVEEKAKKVVGIYPKLPPYKPISWNDTSGMLGENLSGLGKYGSQSYHDNFNLDISDEENDDHFVQIKSKQNSNSNSIAKVNSRSALGRKQLNSKNVDVLFSADYRNNENNFARISDLGRKSVREKDANSRIPLRQNSATSSSNGKRGGGNSKGRPRKTKDVAWSVHKNLGALSDDEM